MSPFVAALGSSLIQAAFAQPNVEPVNTRLVAEKRKRNLTLDGMGVYPVHQDWQQKQSLANDPILQAYLGG